MIFLEGDAGEGIIEFGAPPPGLQPDGHYFAVFGSAPDSAALGHHEAWCLTALGVLEVPMQEEIVSRSGGRTIPASLGWYTETLDIVVGCFIAASISCSYIERAGVFPIKIVVPPRQNLGFACRYGHAPFKLRFAWKKHEAP